MDLNYVSTSLTCQCADSYNELLDYLLNIKIEYFIFQSPGTWGEGDG